MSEPIPSTEAKAARRPDTAPARAVAVSANRAAYWLSRHWLLVFNLFLVIYVALPFLAPALMHYGYQRPANLLYRIYSPACHQMGFRSWFLFGEQSYYPLSETGLPDIHYFEEYVADDPTYAGLELPGDFGALSWEARSFVGNERMGYKVALCQRDIAMYLALVAAGLLFGLLRRHVRPLRWQLFVLLGVVPMLLDGGYQLVTWWLAIAAAQVEISWLQSVAAQLSAVMRPHETVPALRAITGALFGFGLVWMTLPHIQVGMDEMEEQFRDKLTRAGLITSRETAER